MSETTEYESSGIERFPEILGIFSSEAENGDVSAASKKGVPNKRYFYIRQVSEEGFEQQALNANHLPSGAVQRIDLKAFSELMPEPSYYKKITVPALESLREKLERGEKYCCKGLFSAAEREFLDALKLDESNARANFGLGEVYAEKKDFKNLEKVLGALLDLDVTFHEENRRRFNSLGMSLRKNGLFYEAIKYYAKALEYDDKDEHLHFNIARAYFEDDRYGKCEEHVAMALELNPEFREAILFKRYLDENAPSALTGGD